MTYTITDTPRTLSLGGAGMSSTVINAGPSEVLLSAGLEAPLLTAERYEIRLPAGQRVFLPAGHSALRAVCPAGLTASVETSAGIRPE